MGFIQKTPIGCQVSWDAAYAALSVNNVDEDADVGQRSCNYSHEKYRLSNSRSSFVTFSQFHIVPAPSLN